MFTYTGYLPCSSHCGHDNIVSNGGEKVNKKQKIVTYSGMSVKYDDSKVRGSCLTSQGGLGQVSIKLLGEGMELRHKLIMFLYLIWVVACLKLQKNRNRVIPNNCVWRKYRVSTRGE